MIHNRIAELRAFRDLRPRRILQAQDRNLGDYLFVIKERLQAGHDIVQRDSSQLVVMSQVLKHFSGLLMLGRGSGNRIAPAMRQQAVVGGTHREAAPAEIVLGHAGVNCRDDAVVHSLVTPYHAGFAPGHQPDDFGPAFVYG